MRERVLAEGREAAFVGERYTNASAAKEIARWRDAHDGSLDPLLQAIEDCVFVTRRVALLQTLARAIPEGFSTTGSCTTHE